MKILFFFIRRLKSKRLAPSDESGQATLEFALTLTLLMSMVFFFVHSAFSLAWANYIQYATFMSARAYLSAGPTIDDQESRAKEIATEMLKTSGGSKDRFETIAKGDSQGLDGADSDFDGLAIGYHPEAAAKGQAGDANYSWMEGVRYRFKSRLFLIPLSGDSKAPENQLSLQSESWLGREPTEDECKKFFTEDLFKKIFTGASAPPLTEVLDNGC